MVDLATVEGGGADASVGVWVCGRLPEADADIPVPWGENDVLRTW